MKHYSLISLTAIFIVLSTACQTRLDNYRPMVAEGYQWNEIVSFYPDGYMHYRTTIVKLTGDTVVNGIAYKKLMSTDTEEEQQWVLEGLLREDVSNQQVYYLHNGKEFLLYDFGMKVGDKTKLYLCEEYNEAWADNFDYTMELTAINTKEDNQKNIYREFVYEVRMQYKGEEVYAFTHRTMERFGSPEGLISKNMAYIDGDCGYSLLCAYNEDNVLVWSNDYTDAPYAGYCFYNYDEDKDKE